MEHAITETCLERFVTGRTTPAENRSLVVHLLKGCASCSRTLAALTKIKVPAFSREPVLARMAPALWSRPAGSSRSRTRPEPMG